MFSLTGKTAVITGGAKGIGAEIARVFSRNGARVFINYRRSAEKAEDLRDEIVGAGGDAAVCRGDVSIERDARRIIETARKMFGGVDILVNNAGDFLYRDFEEISEETLLNLVRNNTMSALHCMRAALPGMRKNRFGRIIAIGDAFMERGTGDPRSTAYLASKSGLLPLCRDYARSEAPHGITVNIVSAGYIDAGNYSHSFKERIAGEIPLGRLGTTTEVAFTAAFLASGEAGYITGANIVVSGGV